MTEENENLEIYEDELESLKTRATQMGITFHPSIGIEKLREKISARLEDKSEPTPAGDQSNPVYAPDQNSEILPAAMPANTAPTEAEKRKVARDEALKLVRIRITCMNPNKKEWEGEIFTAGNRVVGTVKKYVPYNTEWHVPQIILNMIQERQCQTFYTVKDAHGNKIRRGKLVKEFAVEILPALTPQELKDLAQRQAMANGTAEAA